MAEPTRTPRPAIISVSRPRRRRQLSSSIRRAPRDASRQFIWSDPGDPPGALRDVALFDTIVCDLAERFCVDLDAVFVVGHSLGASFANSLACARGRIARYYPHQWPAGAGPVIIRFFHGLAD